MEYARGDVYIDREGNSAVEVYTYQNKLVAAPGLVFHVEHRRPPASICSRNVQVGRGFRQEIREANPVELRRTHTPSILMHIYLPSIWQYLDVLYEK